MNVWTSKQSGACFSLRYKISSSVSRDSYSQTTNGTDSHRVCRAGAYLCATGRPLGIAELVFVGHAGRLLLAELDVSVGCTLVEPPLTVRALDVIYKQHLTLSEQTGLPLSFNDLLYYLDRR